MWSAVLRYAGLREKAKMCSCSGENLACLSCKFALTSPPAKIRAAPRIALRDMLNNVYILANIYSLLHPGASSPFNERKRQAACCSLFFEVYRPGASIFIEYATPWAMFIPNMTRSATSSRIRRCLAARTAKLTVADNLPELTLP